MRVLLSAFACDPVFGSDEEVGWQWAKELSGRGIDVSVITRRSNRIIIEKFVSQTGLCTNVKFEYIDIDWLHKILRRFNRRNHIYYYFWQLFAYQFAARLHAKHPFDLIHHVTWVSFRQPSFMGLIDVPMFFGPVAGGDEIPESYSRSFSFNQRIVEVIRGMANSLVCFDPLMRMTYHRATKVFFTSEGHFLRVPSFVREKSQIELAIGCDESIIKVKQRAMQSKREGNRLLFVGRCIGWKGMDLGLQIFAKVHRARPDVTLTVVGDGVDRKRWMKAADQLSISEAIDWRGWIPKDDVFKLYSEFDVLFYPSLRDSGGFVVLEALQCGLPVVCFHLGGPGVVVDDSCGAAIEASSDIEETIERYADAVLATLVRVQEQPDIYLACQARVNKFTWDALIGRIYGPLLNVKEAVSED